jgi:hypothetical protein
MVCFLTPGTYVASAHAGCTAYDSHPRHREENLASSQASLCARVSTPQISAGIPAKVADSSKLIEKKLAFYSANLLRAYLL